MMNKSKYFGVNFHLLVWQHPHHSRYDFNCPSVSIINIIILSIIMS